MGKNVFMKRMPAGIPGQVTRLNSSTLETVQLGNAPIPFGAPVKVVAGLLAPLGNGDTASVIYGFLARPYPTMGTATSFGTAEATAGSLQNVMRRGYLAVEVKAGTPAKAGKVYVRTTGAIGTIEAASGAGLVELPGGTFMGEADTDGLTEISYNI